MGRKFFPTVIVDDDADLNLSLLSLEVSNSLGVFCLSRTEAPSSLLPLRQWQESSQLMTAWSENRVPSGYFNSTLEIWLPLESKA